MISVPMPAKRGTRVEVFAAFTISAILIVAFGQWLDNSIILTSNGLWKSTTVTAWKTDWRTASLDPSNYIYYPLMAAFCRLLDLLGVHAGQAWRQMVVVNGLFAGVSVAALYWMVRTLTGRREIAMFAALFQIGCGYFLGLAVCSEDILPSFTLLFVAMVTAAVRFGAPTARQVMFASVFFTLGWLGEWRLIFPLLPPLVLALALSEGSLVRRAARIGLFLVVMIAVASITAIVWQGHLGSTDLQGVLWTGKGVDTGWAGFSLDKLVTIAGGMGEYWLGGRNMPVAHLAGSAGIEWSLAFVAELVLLVLGILYFWRRRGDHAMRAVAIVFLGAFGAGEVMNAYSQPGDPQMQINVMPWLIVVAALLVADLTARYGRVLLLPALMIVSLSLAHNLSVLGQSQGQDSLAVSNLDALAAISNPDSTVYVFTGFEGIVTWLFIAWDPHWEGVCEVGPSPQPGRKFKWAALFGPLVHHPNQSEAEYLADVQSEIECAFDKGYKVIAAPVYGFSPAQLADWMTPLGKKSFAPGLLDLLHSYSGAPAGKPVNGETYYELKRTQLPR